MEPFARLCLNFVRFIVSQLRPLQVFNACKFSGTQEPSLTTQPASIKRGVSWGDPALRSSSPDEKQLPLSRTSPRRRGANADSFDQVAYCGSCFVSSTSPCQVVVEKRKKLECPDRIGQVSSSRLVECIVF